MRPGNTSAPESVRFQSSKRDDPCLSPTFSVYNVGQALDGLVMTEASRLCAPTDPAAPELARQDDVTYLYGECPEESGGALTIEGGCLPPIEVQSSPLCQKHVALYHGEPGPYPYEGFTIKGVPAALFDGGLTIEIYTADTTISVYGLDAARVRQFAEGLKLALPEDIPAEGQTLLSLSAASTLLPPLGTLPPPSPLTLQQTEPSC